MPPANLESMLEAMVESTPDRRVRFLHTTRYLDEASFLSLRLVSWKMHDLGQPITETIFARYLETVQTNLSYDSILRIHCDLARPRGNPLASLVKRLVIRYPFEGRNSAFNRMARSNEIEDPLAMVEIRALRSDLATAFTNCRDFELHLDEPASRPVDYIHSADVARVMFIIFNDAAIPLSRVKIRSSLRPDRALEQPTTSTHQLLQLPNFTVPPLYPEVLAHLRVLHVHDDYFREFRGTSIVWELLEGTPMLEELRITGPGCKAIRRRDPPAHQHTGNILEVITTARLASSRIRVFSVRKMQSTAELLRQCVLKMAARGLERLDLREVVLLDISTRTWSRSSSSSLLSSVSPLLSASPPLSVLSSSSSSPSPWEEVFQSIWTMCLYLERINFKALGVRDERDDQDVYKGFEPKSSCCARR
ncbi:uncharacterized protein BP01DRAFT_419813 [Aspergillus saccharolyticus JOP 1030-1]|uniref:Uncharacterized protein n=1 Tax=Aspergillus saccharolyticus JOP 1030-1 TaxID=1450539 RepID=A0A318ZSJ3_9EURO|nr:hypothetical protein BP01DRAFT_419813 [Aspergillus saccharolyticus JOP 1030-1]PYH49665.1 hypothetical protein BP01DRAFT_419813 [Aspergillus saccharolyticus JOP 1030-1]